jgi:hypothetical protein
VPLIPDDEMQAVYAGTVVDAGSGSGSGSGSGDGTVRLYTVDRSRAGFFGFVTSTTQLEDRLYRVKIVRAYPELRLWVVYYATAYARLPGTATPFDQRPYALTFTGRYAPDGSAIPPSRSVTCSGTSHDVSTSLSLNLNSMVLNFTDYNGVSRSVTISAVVNGALTDNGIGTWVCSLTASDGLPWQAQFSPCGVLSILLNPPDSVSTYGAPGGNAVLAYFNSALGTPTAFDPYALSFSGAANEATGSGSFSPDATLTATGSVGEGSGGAVGSGSGPLEELDLFQGDPVCCTPAGSHEWTIIDAPLSTVDSGCCANPISTVLLLTILDDIEPPQDPAPTCLYGQSATMTYGSRPADFPVTVGTFAGLAWWGHVANCGADTNTTDHGEYYFCLYCSGAGQWQLSIAFAGTGGLRPRLGDGPQHVAGGPDLRPVRR